MIPGLHSLTSACKMSAMSYSNAGHRPPLSHDGHHPHLLFRYNGAILPDLDQCPQLLQPHAISLFYHLSGRSFSSKERFYFAGWLVGFCFAVVWEKTVLRKFALKLLHLASLWGNSSMLDNLSWARGDDTVQLSRICISLYVMESKRRNQLTPT